MRHFPENRVCLKDKHLDLVMVYITIAVQMLRGLLGDLFKAEPLSKISKPLQ